MTDHRITPPPELVNEWKRTAPHPINKRSHYHYISFCAAQWGSDQELEACLDWLDQNCGRWEIPVSLREARRPKPPSLKEQALHELNDVYNRDKIDDSTYDTIRRAVEALDD